MEEGNAVNFVSYLVKITQQCLRCSGAGDSRVVRALFQILDHDDAYVVWSRHEAFLGIL